ncbi:MAG: hypothetical protein IT563_23620 [Alphaproteobacteria bacterium]|nr:hypothetical protein [Alphaproteobacteria bacterium]
MALRLHTITESDSASVLLRRPKTRYQASTVMSIYLPENLSDALDEFRRPHALTRSEAIAAILRGFFTEERPADA